MERIRKEEMMYADDLLYDDLAFVESALRAGRSLAVETVCVHGGKRIMVSIEEVFK